MEDGADDVTIAAARNRIMAEAFAVAEQGRDTRILPRPVPEADQLEATRNEAVWLHGVLHDVRTGDRISRKDQLAKLGAKVVEEAGEGGRVRRGQSDAARPLSSFGVGAPPLSGRRAALTAWLR